MAPNPEIPLPSETQRTFKNSQICLKIETDTDFESTAQNSAQATPLTHTKGKRVNCPLCKTLGKKWHLNHDNIVHHPEKIYKCLSCSKKFENKSKLERHKRLKRKRKKFACSICSFQTIKVKFLRRHTIKSHGEKKPFGCPMCSFRGNRYLELEIHLRIHTGEKPYKCRHDNCNYSARTRMLLTSHQKVHTKEKKFHDKMKDEQFSCPFCPYRSKEKSSLRKHLTFHQEQNRFFKCSFCSFESKSESTLTDHIHIHKKGNTFKCEEPNCDYVSHSSYNLKQHQPVHQRRGNLECLDCKKKFKTKFNFDRHNKSKAHLIQKGWNRRRHRVASSRDSQLNERSSSTPKLMSKSDGRLFQDGGSKRDRQVKDKIEGVIKKQMQVFRCNVGDCQFRTVRVTQMALHLNVRHRLPHIPLLKC